MIYFDRKIPIWGVSTPNRLWTIMEVCKTWLSPIDPRSSSSSMILISLTDWARETRTIIIWRINSRPRKTSRNFKEQIFPQSYLSPTKLNTSPSLMLRKSKPSVLMLNLTKASILLWIISKVMSLRNCSQIRMCYLRCKVSFRLWRVTVETRQICSLSQTPTSPKARTILSILSQ